MIDYPGTAKLDPYPIPRQAAPIYIVGDRLMLILIGPTGAGHTLAFPITAEGIKKLADVLRARTQNLNAKIGTPGSPVQYDIDKMLEEMRRKAKPKDVFTDEQREATKSLLRKMGLI